MEVRLPLAWKSHPVLIDPHPPPSLHSRLSLSLPLLHSLLRPSFPQYPLVFSLNYRHCFHFSISLSLRHPLRPSPSLPLAIFQHSPFKAFAHVLSHPSGSLPFSPSPPSCQPREEIHFREKKGKKARKIDVPARLAALGRARGCIRPRRVRGRGLKMSSRCVIAYIDPTPPGVYAAPTDATPTRGAHGCAGLARCVRGRARCVRGRDRGPCAVGTCMHYACMCTGMHTGWSEKDGLPRVISIVSSGLILMTSHVVVIGVKFQIHVISE